MPTIKIIDAIRLYMYFFDHNPPHFHAVHAEYEELIVIETLETHEGELPKRQRKKVIDWASQNREFLRRKWNEYNP